MCFSEDSDSLIHATFRDGSEKCYGNPFANDSKKLWDTVDAIRTHTTPICTVKTAMAHTALIGLLHQMATYRPFPASEIVSNASDDGVFVRELFEQMYHAYESTSLLSELA